MEINYVNLLDKRLESYRERYPKKPFWVFVKMIFWSVTYFIARVFKPYTKAIGKDKNTLYIGLAAGGGFGDYLISANYIMYFKKYVQENFVGTCKLQFDFYAGSPYSAEAVFINSGLIDNLYKNKYHRSAKRYDLYLSLTEPFPNVMWVNRNKINILCPKLMTLIDEYVQSQLGHASITMTMDLYTHLLPEVNDKCVNLLNSIVNTTVETPEKVVRFGT